MIDFTPPFTDAWPISSTFQDHLDRTPPSTAPGVDIAAGRGTPILAVAPGKVYGIKRRKYGGLSLWIAHDGGYHSYYAHLSAFCVVNGDVVGRGDKIGEVGSTGASTGPHLHWSIRRGQDYVDPMPLLEQKAGVLD